MRVVFLDTETTGFVEPEHRLVEFYGEVWDMKARQRLDLLDQRIDPKRSMPIEAQRVHNISMSDLIGQPEWPTVAPAIMAMIQGADLAVAHNAEFDREFLNMELRRIGLATPSTPWFCTMENASWATPIGKKASLSELCYAMEVPYDPSLAHAASYDVGVMRECFFRAVDWGFFTLPHQAAQAA